MTVSEARSLAQTLRPDAKVTTALENRWLREVDLLLRERVVRPAQTEEFEGLGADNEDLETLSDDTVLLAPEQFEGLYPHYLCAQIDLAQGEQERYNTEMGCYNSILAELTVWMRRNYLPRGGSQIHAARRRNHRCI